MLACFFVGLFLSGQEACSQAQNSGTIVGQIVDGKGYVVQGAHATLTSEDQGRVVESVSGEGGTFVFNGLPTAKYTLKIEAATFAPYTLTNVVVDAGVSNSIRVVLKPQSDTSQVVVEAEGTTIDTHSATIGTVISNELVENLPLDGNNVVEVAALLPGVSDVNAPTTFTSNLGGPTYTASGSRSNQNLLLLDGTIWNNLYNNTGLNFPTPNALQEVSVLLNNYKAQYGRNVGSVFNVLTKSGSNNVHGTIWEFAQNRSFNATDYISRANPPLVQNQFGVAVGGPIMRNRLFYFGSFQDLISDAAVVAQAQTLTLNQRGLTSSGAALPCVTPAYSSYTCASFQEDQVSTWNNPVYTSNGSLAITALNAAYQASTGNSGQSPCVTLLLSQPKTLANPEIPSICWNAVSRALLARTPIPTLSQPGATLPYAISVQKQPRNDKAGSLRFDYIRGKHTIDTHYYQTAVNDHTANGVSSGQGVATYEVNVNTGAIHNGNIGDTWVISGSLINVARAAYKRYDYRISPTDPTTLQQLGATYTQPDDIALPQVVIDGRVGYNLGNSTSSQHSVDEDVELNDAITWVHRTHNIQAGIEYLRLQYLNRTTEAPYLTFNTTYTPDAAMDYTLGLLFDSIVGNSTNLAAIQHDLYGYIQDDWRVTSRLTLNYGVRYELPFQWYQPDGQAATFIPGYHSVVFPTAPANLAFVGDPGIERSLVGTSYNNVAPRFGFAYDVHGKGQTIIRGGFGIFYDAINALVVGISEPYHYSAKYIQNPGGLSQPLLGLNPIPGDYTKSQPPQFTTPYQITFPDQNFRTPYTQALNFGFQQRPRYGLLGVNYVGHFSRHLALGVDMNPAIYDCSGAYYQLNPSVYCTNASTSQASYNARVVYPNFNNGGKGALDYMTIGSASYNALQVAYQIQSRYLTAVTSYTFSKSLDNSSNGTSITNTSDRPTISAHRAVSDFNAEQIFNFGWTLKTPTLTQTIAPLRALVNNWGLNILYNLRSGHPFNVTVADITLRDEGPEYGMFVPEGYAPLPKNRSRTSEINEWFNTSSFELPGTYGYGIYGDVPRNFLNGPHFMSTTFGVQRQIPLSSSGGRSFTFRADAFNVFNMPNFGQPYGSLSGAASKNASFGTILSTVGNNGAVGTNGRRIQLSGTIRF